MRAFLDLDQAAGGRAWNNEGTTLRHSIERMKMTSVSSTQNEFGTRFVLFSWGFRPFFLAAGAYAAIAMTAWLTWIAIHASSGALTYITISEPPHLWHAHEMIYGFATAAAAGFLLTAIPNWTGADRYQGTPLMMLFALWFAGRVVMWFTAHLPAGLVAVVDMAFIPALVASAARQLFIRPAARNLIFIVLLGVLIAGNTMFHLARIGTAPGWESAGVRLGLFVFVLMIGIIGGRIIPAFTHNALNKRGIRDAMPQRFALLDAASLVSIVLFILAAISGLPPAVLGTVALAAALVNTVRMALWRPDKVLREPILWVLHLGYAWLVLGLFLAGAASFWDAVGEVAMLHAFGTGAIGTMILAVMSRASLGHTGRPLTASPTTAAAYVLVSVAAALRVFGAAAFPQLYNEVMLAAGLAWIAAFVIFTAVFAPILTRPRVNLKVQPGR